VEAQFVPWNWLVPILVSCLILIISYIIQGMRTDISCLQKEKLDKVEYIREHALLREEIKTIGDKLDDLKDLILKRGCND